MNYFSKIYVIAAVATIILAAGARVNAKEFSLANQPKISIRVNDEFSIMGPEYFMHFNKKPIWDVQITSGKDVLSYSGMQPKLRGHTKPGIACFVAPCEGQFYVQIYSFKALKPGTAKIVFKHDNREIVVTIDVI